MDKMDKDERKVQYYSNGRFSDSRSFDNSYNNNYDDMNPPRKRLPSWAKALIIIGLVIVLLVFMVYGCSGMAINLLGLTTSNTINVSTNFGHEYIGTLYVQDTIDEYGTGLYNHQYLLNAIDAMMADDDNLGMMLYINTPGGSVYASDELYLKIKEYQEETGRPVYASMQSQAASGGYYIAAGCDKIIANRNCWTGSIGVTMGTFIDLSQFLENLGIKTTTITSGDNKAMGSNFDEMTSDQRAILQALIDEAYDQFVEIVAEGRGMTTEQVRVLADGRIYSALQAVDNGLVDQIGTYEEALQIMVSECNMGSDVRVEDFQSYETAGLSSLLGILSQQQGSSSKASLGSATDAEGIEALIALNGTFRLSYISNVTK